MSHKQIANSNHVMETCDILVRNIFIRKNGEEKVSPKTQREAEGHFWAKHQFPQLQQKSRGLKVKIFGTLCPFFKSAAALQLVYTTGLTMVTCYCNLTISVNCP